MFFVAGLDCEWPSQHNQARSMILSFQKAWKQNKNPELMVGPTRKRTFQTVQTTVTPSATFCRSLTTTQRGEESVLLGARQS